MSPPNFIIIGAMKCGTSTLASQLGAQDRFFMTSPKEPNFFSDDEIYEKGLKWYLGLFEAAGDSDFKGEASTHYTKIPEHPLTISRLKAAFQDPPKFLYLIRDPFARAVSHYIHEWTMGVIKTDINRALKEYPSLISYGQYGMQLSPWIDAFGAQSIHVDTLEAMKENPHEFICRIGNFLECPRLKWLDDLGHQNISSERIRRRPLDRILIENKTATMLRQKFIPKSIREKIKSKRQMNVRPTINTENTIMLREIYSKDRTKLHALLPGRLDLDISYSMLDL